MKKVLFTIIGAMAIISSMTSCKMEDKSVFETESQVIRPAYNIGYCCPSEPETKQLARKIKESGYADHFNDIVYVDEYYDIDKELKNTVFELKFKNVNGVEVYTKTVHVIIQSEIPEELKEIFTEETINI